MDESIEGKHSPLQIELSKKDQEIADLKDQIELLTASANGEAKTAHATLKEVQNQLTKARGQITDLEEINAKLKTRFDLFAPIEIDVPLLPDSATKAEHEKQGRNTVWASHKDTCAVAVTITIRRIENGKPLWEVAKRHNLIFPGTVEDAKAEIPTYIEALLARAPFPENLKRRRIQGVTEQQFLAAMEAVAAWWHLEDFRRNDQGDYWKRLKRTFDHFILPNISEETDEIEARTNWRAAVEDTFANMAKYGRGRSDKPRIRKQKRAPNFKSIP